MNFLKNKITKIILAGLIALTSSASLTAIFIKNNGNKIEATSFDGIFTAVALTTKELKIDYNFGTYSSDYRIEDLEEIKYIFTPIDGNESRVITDTQSDEFPPAFNVSGTYTTGKKKFVIGGTYKGEAEITAYNGKSGTTVSVVEFATTIKMPSGTPEWDLIDTIITPGITGAAIQARIKGVKDSPSDILDPENFSVKITNSENSENVVEMKYDLSELKWKQEDSIWELEEPIKIKDELKPETDYNAIYFLQGNGRNINSNITDKQEIKFKTDEKVEVIDTDWIITSKESEYTKTEITIESENIFHDFHGSLLKNANIKEIKNITTGGFLDPSVYQNINNSLDKWVPMDNKPMEETWTLENLAPDTDYEGVLSVEYKEKLVKMPIKREIPFTFSTKDSKKAPIVVIRDISYIQTSANKWKIDFCVDINPEVVLVPGEENATYEDVKELKITLSDTVTGETKQQIIESDQIKQTNTIFFDGMSANTNYDVKIETTMKSNSLPPLDAEEVAKTPKNAPFTRPDVISEVVTAESLKFDLEWNRPFLGYQENISEMHYSTDNKSTWTKVNKERSKNYTELIVDGLDANDDYTVWLKIVQNSNTEYNFWRGNKWKLGSYRTDRNIAPSVRILSNRVTDKKVEFDLDITNSENLTGITIETTDLTTLGKGIPKIEVEKAEIKNNMTLVIDSLIDLNKYEFKITFNTDDSTCLTNITSNIGGVPTNNVWTSGEIETYPEQMKISNSSCSKNNNVTLEGIVNLTFDISSIKGYSKVKYIIKGSDGNEIQRIESTNPLEIGKNTRIIGNLKSGYTIRIELWGKAFNDKSSTNTITMHDEKEIKIDCLS